MEDKEISLNPPPQPLLKLPRLSISQKQHGFSLVSKPVEANQKLDTSKQNLHQMPKNIPSPDFQIEKILANKLDPSTAQKIFLVKYKFKSYFEIKWISASEFGNQKDILDEYLKNNPNESPVPYFNEKYLIPEKVFSVKKVKQQTQYLVKWTDLDYAQATWENEHSLQSLLYDKDHNIIKEFEERTKVTSKKTSILQNTPSFRPILELHQSKEGNQLDSFQIDILNFLMNSYCYSQNVLITGIEHVNVRCGVVNFLEGVINQGRGSFLIVCDQSLIEQWESDIIEWTNIPFLSFVGSKENLEVMKKYEFCKPNIAGDDFIYPIYITTIENLTVYHKAFAQTTWECVILDNSQMDNVIFDKSSLTFIVNKFKMKYRIFMTPPLEEVDPHIIWPWLNFIDPNNFHLESRFTKSFCKEGKFKYEKLNNSSFAFFDKSNDANFDLNEVFVKCPLTDIQEESVRTIYEPLINNPELDSSSPKNIYNIRQILQSTRKILNHPFLMKEIATKVIQENKKTFSSNYSIYESEIFLKSSGKLFVLDMLLKKFKSESKNVVIICQTSDSIEIIEKYMLAKFYSYEKVDLFRRGRSRYDAVMQFNDESKRIFAFILDAKTGYFTMKADHVIIYESDWNPKCDIFIANKILSLKKEKEVYRLITEKTYECAFVKNFKFSGGNNNLSNNNANLDKLVHFGLDEMLSEDAITENDILLSQYLNSEEPDTDSLLHDHTFVKKYSSIKEMSDIIPIDKWEQYELKTSSKGSFESLELESGKKNSKNSNGNSKSSDNEDDDDDDDDGDENENSSLAEEEEFNEEEFDEAEKVADADGWTPKLIFHLFNLMLKYGITSWEMFSKSIPIPANKISMVGAILIHELLMKSENKESFVILQKYVNHFNLNNFIPIPNLKNRNEKVNFLDSEFVKKHEKEIQKITSPRVDWKLDRLEFLYFVDISCSAKEKFNGERTIPSARQSTLENDYKIIELVKKKGFPITKLTSSLKNTKMTLKKVNSRAITLIDELKSIFIEYCQMFELGEELTPEKLIDSLKMLNVKERKKIFQTIQLVGTSNMEELFEASKLKKDRRKYFHKFMDHFIKFAHNVIRYKKVPFDFFGAHYTLRTLTDGISNVAILNYLREVVDINNMPEKDRPIFEYIKENGLRNIKKQEIFTGRFKEPIDQSVINYLHSYFGSKKKYVFANFFKGIESPSNSPNKFEFHNNEGESKENANSNVNEDLNSKLAQLSKYIDFNLPEGKFLSDDEISSMLPLKINENTIITNFGKVVTDRPNFHNERYLYLDGYTSERYYASTRDPNKKEWYICSIKDKGGDSPVFIIQSKENPKIIFEGNVPSRPSIELVTMITHIKNRSKHLSKSPTISGPEFFAFASPKVRKIMARLPGADKCPKFKGYKLNVQNEDDIKHLKTEDSKARNINSRISFSNDEGALKSKNRREKVDNDEEEEEEEEIEVRRGRPGRRRKNISDYYSDDDENEEEEDEIESGSDEEEFKIRPKIGKKNKRSKQYDSYDEEDSDNKSLIQRVKGYLKGKNNNKGIMKRYNLRKRETRKNYNEYEEDEEEEYDENDYGYDDDDEVEEEEEQSRSKRQIKNRRNDKRSINKNRNFTEDDEYEYDSNDDDDGYDSNEDDDYDSNSNSPIYVERISINNKKHSPDKSLTRFDIIKSKEKKNKVSGVSHLSDSSDENNYYDFACNNIFSEEKIHPGNKSNKNINVLSSGVVFYFDKLTNKPEKELMINYFTNDNVEDDDETLFLDRDFLAEFLNENPGSNIFANK